MCQIDQGGVDRRGDTAEGIGAVAQYRGRTGGVSKGMGRAGSSKRKGGQAERGEIKGLLAIQTSRHT